MKIILLFLCILYSFEISDVYFTKEISPEKVVEMFKKLNISLPGKVGLKVHTGEIGGAYFLRPDFLQNIYDYTNGTFIECNTAYPGYDRHYTEGHRKVLKANGWVNNSRRAVIMDEDPENDFNLTVNNPHNISENIVGGHIKDFDSCIVLAHYKGHAMGGFGGALKQLSIGFASRAGKANIHSGGYTTDYNITWAHEALQKDFTAAMGDAASTIVEYFKKKGEIVYINCLVNISLYCDCGVGAPAPRIRDIGILASLDPVAIDKACYDLINKENTTGSQTWIQRANNKLALHTLEVAEDHGIGTMEYNLINVDEDEPETDTTEPGKDTDTTEPGKDTDTTEPGQDTDTTEPGQDTDTTEPGTDTDTTEPGTDTDTTEPGADTDTTEPYQSGKTDSDSDKNLALYIAIPIASVVVIAVIIIIVLRLRKRRVTQSLIEADELGETMPD